MIILNATVYCFLQFPFFVFIRISVNIISPHHKFKPYIFLAYALYHPTRDCYYNPIINNLQADKLKTNSFF